MRRASQASWSPICSGVSPRTSRCRWYSSALSGARTTSASRARVGNAPLGEQGPDVGVPEAVRAGLEPGAARLGAQHERKELFEQVNHRPVERLQSCGGWCTRAERRRSGQEAGLEVALVVVQQGDRDGLHIGEAAVESRPADAGRARHILHRHGARVLGTEEIGGRGQHQCPVARCVRSFPPWGWGRCRLLTSPGSAVTRIPHWRTVPQCALHLDTPSGYAYRKPDSAVHF